MLELKQRVERLAATPSLAECTELKRQFQTEVQGI